MEIVESSREEKKDDRRSSFPYFNEMLKCVVNRSVVKKKASGSKKHCTTLVTNFGRRVSGDPKKVELVNLWHEQKV